MSAPSRAQVLARWQALSPREQRGVSALGTLLAVCVFWLVAIAPALNTWRDSDHRRARIEQQHAHMLALQAQAQALQARTPLSRDEALRSLQSLSVGTPMPLSVQGDRVSVQLKAVPAHTLAHWLAQAHRQAQTLPIEAHLTRSTSGTTRATTSTEVMWDGQLVLQLPRRDAATN